MEKNQTAEMPDTTQGSPGGHFGPILIAVVITAIIVGGGMYLWFGNNDQPETTPTPTPTAQETDTPTPTSNQDPVSYKVYENTVYRVEYPSDWTITTGYGTNHSTARVETFSVNSSGDESSYGKTMTVSYGLDNIGQTLDQYLETIKRVEGNPNWEIVSTLQISGVDAYKARLPESDAPFRYIFVIDPFLFDISIRGNSAEGEVFLSSFEFLK